jgi:hypothetical protein
MLLFKNPRVWPDENAYGIAYGIKKINLLNIIKTSPIAH